MGAKNNFAGFQVFFFPPPLANVQIRILTWRAFRRRKNPETMESLFPRIRLHFLFSAPSEENANLNYGLAHISPKKPRAAGRSFCG